MAKFRTVIPCFVAMICLTFLLSCSSSVDAASVTISTDQPIYPIWGLGGQVRVTANGLAQNITYYLWLQAPNESASNFTGLSFPHVAVGLPALLVLSVPSRNPPGTYLLSASQSASTDTRIAVTHFGVVGTNAQNYERTETVTIAGGGFAANTPTTLAVGSVAVTFPGFPVNVTINSSGGFQYSFRLAPSIATGKARLTLTGTAYDNHQTITTSSSFTITETNFTARIVKSPASQVQRTTQVVTAYQLSYVGGFPVTEANANATILLGTRALYTVPLVLTNSTAGEWTATWSPSPSTSNATYRFQFNPANFTDAYGNKGQGAVLSSANFDVVPAKLQPTISPTPALALQRTQDLTFTITATYPNGGGITNVTQASIMVLRSDGTKAGFRATLNGNQATASFKIPVSAALGNWTVEYYLQDVWNNSGSGGFTFQVEPASLNFEAQTPYSVERTTSLNLTNTILYPDGTAFNSTVSLKIYAGNQSWTPNPTYDPVSSRWSESLYIPQNGTLGQYNITWAARDPYGNVRSSNYTTLVEAASFSFVVEMKNSTASTMTNLDIPVLIRYPNGSSLTNIVGNATGSYQNSTGYVFTFPLVYNDTNSTWHMFFFVPEQGNATISFAAQDRFGNSAVAMDAYNLKISNVPHVITRYLIIAGVIGAMVPIGLLAWAFATISTRRRKHKP